MDAPRLPVQGPSAWTDIQGMAGLRHAAAQDSKAALPAVARQFESLFTQMLIKSMRDASFGGGILDSSESNQWRDMFDKQIALSLANDGKGMGIAAMLVRQLGGKQSATPAANTDPTALSPQLLAARTLALGAADTTAPADTALAANDGINGTSGDAGFIERALQFAKDTGHAALQAAQKWVFAGPEDFVQKLAPYAQAAAEKLGVSVRAILAQAALETGWGRHMPTQADGSSSHNLFGIKAGSNWDGKCANVATLEFENGVAVHRNAAFRAYSGPMQSIADYAQLIGDSPRYAGALGRGDDIAGFAHALHRAGYATDPHYAAKLTTIANSDVMRDALAALKNSLPMPKAGL
ncbi:MAG TPA: flagellar assembly peptidoglycan hydrolase FlgJ [Gammaproteobacteria bacterium]|nr:flagellar assembly peptidoglycan hydrolase FlgJ [Gammaproteobacteria bacterium]